MTSSKLSSSKVNAEEIKHLWQTTDMDAKYLAYKFGVSDKTIRNFVTGLPSPHKERRTLSQFHRQLGLLVIDKRLASLYTKHAFAQAHGLTHIRLSDIEKGYHDLTITEIIRLELFDAITGMDASLLEND